MSVGRGLDRNARDAAAIRARRRRYTPFARRTGEP